MFVHKSTAQAQPPNASCKAHVRILENETDEQPKVYIESKDIVCTENGEQIKTSALITDAYNVPQAMRDNATDCRLILSFSNKKYEMGNDDRLCMYHQEFAGQPIYLTILPPSATISNGNSDNLLDMGVTPRGGQQPQQD